MRVAIDARLESGSSGGVEAVIIGLAHGLSRLSEPGDEYAFLALEGCDAWLQPYVSGPARILTVRRPAKARIARALPWVAGTWGLRPWKRPQAGPLPSDGTLERHGMDVVHLTLQAGFLTSIPSIYHPHDLQHVHMPEYFSDSEIRMREAYYETLCRQAAMVAVASSWTKADVERHLRIPPEKVKVVPLAPPTDALAEPRADQVAEARRRLGLPDAFVLYPAQTWRHKNHIGLIEALAALRQRSGLVVPLVACGAQTSYFSTIAQRTEELGIADQVHWLGFVEPGDLRVLYAEATAVVIPTLFEAASAPLWEAFRAGVPAACSDVTSLPEQAGDAALLFDPRDQSAIESAISRLWTDGPLRDELVSRGRRRVAGLSWDRTARIFRAHYRRLANVAMAEEDRALAAAPPPL